MTQHIRYLNISATICQRPDLLGDDFVFVDNPEMGNVTCKECFSLLFTHNQREYEKEGGLTYVKDDEPQSMDFFHGLVWALVFCSCFWVTLGVVLWGIYHE